MFDFLDGKKTVIGTGLLIGGAVLTEVVTGIWGVTEAWVSNAASTCNWFGIVLGGTGLGHKVLKKAKK